MRQKVKKWMLPLFAMCLGVFLSRCTSSFPEGQLNSDEDYELIYDYVETRSDLSIYKALCDYTGFVGTVSTAGTYTALVPTDGAFQVLFNELGIENYEDETPEFWLSYLQYHTLTASMATGSFSSGLLEDEPTLLGEDFMLTVNISEFPYLVFNSSAQIIEPDISKQNGYVHILDAVLEPPVASVWDLMEENGGYTQMMALFEEYGLDTYLKDSTVTVLAEPDFVIERSEVDLNAISNMEDWLKYHIISGERSFTTDLDGRLVQTLYAEDGITFNFLSVGGDMEIMYCNRRFPFCNRSGYTPDQLALNGLLQPLDSVLQIVEHSPGTMRMNLYGGTNTYRGYEQNVFTTSPARVMENYGMASYHQGRYYPCCYFSPYQVGDEFWFTIPDVVPGSYQVRLIYYSASAPTMSMLYNDAIVTSDIAFASQTGTFEEWTEMQYKDCGIIEVLETGDVTLYFQVTGIVAVGMNVDMVELRPLI